MAEEAGLKKIGLASLVLVLFALVVIMGGAVLNQFSQGVRVRAQATEVEIDTQGTNESVAIGTAYAFPQTLTSCFNSTTPDAGALPTSDYRVIPGLDPDVGGTLLLLASANRTFQHSEINCTVNYLDDSDAQATADVMIIALYIFGTFAGILSIALIGRQIIRLFSQK